LREGARIAQFCNAEVFLLAVVELSAGTGTLEGGLAFSISEQIEVYKNVLGEGVERLTAMGFLPTARLGIGGAGREIAGVAEEIGVNLVVIGDRPDGPLARWLFGIGRDIPGQESSMQRPSERGASVPMAKRTDGRRISLQTRELLGSALHAPAD
jgi:hypothetical protein